MMRCLLEVVVMPGLVSVIDELCTEDLAEVPDDVLEADLVEIRRALDGLEAQFLRRVAEVDRRQSFAARGVLSTTALLVGSCGLAGSTAREKVRVARRLELMPLTGAALAAGEVSYSQVRLLATAAETDPELFREHEETLVEAARTLTVRELRQVIDYWGQAALVV